MGQRLGWHLERDCFEASTPLGVKPMCNLVHPQPPTLNPKSVSWLRGYLAHKKTTTPLGTP